MEKKHSPISLRIRLKAEIIDQIVHAILFLHVSRYVLINQYIIQKSERKRQDIIKKNLI